MQRGAPAQSGDFTLNSGRSKTPNDTVSLKPGNRNGELAKHIRMVTQGAGNLNQRRLFNGSVDFNQTDTLANRYLRDLQSSSITRIAGGSVSPNH